MDSDRESQALCFLSGLALGAMIGAGVAILTTPQSGRRTRRRLRRSVRRARSGAGDRLDALSAEMKERVDEIVGTARERIG
jgi:gas vesicle protein